jgi:perosamine synthetase
LFNDKSTASYGDISCFSFQGAKLLVSGEGGVLTTNNKDIYEKAFKIGDSGRMPGTFWIDTYGKKMKMTNITAALAVAQLHSAERQISQKRQISAWYKELLGGIDGLSFQLESANTRSICWMTSILIDRKGFDREDFRAKLLDMKIDTRPVFPAISQYPIWDLSNNPQPVAKWIGENALNLPSGVRLTKNSVERVCEAIKSLL